LAAGVAAVGEYKRLDLIERSREMGRYLGNRLKALQDNHPSVGDVRGLGLFWGLELVRNRKSKLAFNTREEKLEGRPMVADAVAAECMKNGTYINSWINCLIVAPPLIIKREEIDQGISALDSALGLADAHIA
jgi:taurine--2-oxoglutarate transaminase